MTLNPELIITKTVTKDDEMNRLNFQIVVENTGNVTLDNIIVEDPKVGLSTLVETLEAGESVTFTPSLTITQQMIDEKCYINTATASVVEFLIEARVQTPEGSLPTYEGMVYRVLFSEDDQAEFCFTQSPALTILKEITAGNPYSVVNDEVEYKYTVT